MSKETIQATTYLRENLQVELWRGDIRSMKEFGDFRLYFRSFMGLFSAKKIPVLLMAVNLNLTAKERILLR